MSKKRIGVYGALCPIGTELLRALLVHPFCELAFAASDHNEGVALAELLPGLRVLTREPVASMDPSLAAETDLVFHAGGSFPELELLEKLTSESQRDHSFKLIDLSPLSRPAASKVRKGSGQRCLNEDTSKLFTYGFLPGQQEEISASKCVSMPDPLLQGLLLGLLPLASAGIVQRNVSASTHFGVEGIEQTPSQTPELSEPLATLPMAEATYWMEARSGIEIDLKFSTIRTPGRCGVITTIFADISENVTLRSVDELYRDQFGDTLFESLTSQPLSPHQLLGTNLASLYVTVSGNTAVISISYDYLGRGSALEAIRCANLMLGVPEEAGLMWPGSNPR